jgi:glycosyltransferase involved in cell wall biosynthesis
MNITSSQVQNPNIPEPAIQPAKFEGKSEPTELPFISIVIAVYNEEKYISDTLNQLINQSYPDDCYEILIIDGESKDQTLNIADSYKSKFKNLKTFVNPKRLAGSSRNIGVKNSLGEYVLFIDGHVFIENKNLLKDMVGLFEETGCDVLSRPQPLIPPHNTYFQNAIAFARASLIGHGLGSTIYNLEYQGEVNPSSSGAMYRRSVFERHGLIDEDFDAAEDFEFNYRLAKNNIKSYTSPRLAVFYYPRNSLVSLFNQMKRYGVGRYNLFKKHPETILNGAFAPAGFYVILTLSLLASLFAREIILLPILMSSVYLFAVIASSIYVAFRKGIKYLFVLPLIYLTIHFGLAFGFLRGMFTKRKNQADLA